MNNFAELETLKSELFNRGAGAISDVLGYDVDPDEDKDIIDNRLDMAFAEMSNSQLYDLYFQYCL